MSNRFCIIDEYSQFYQAFYVIMGLRTSAGQPINAVYDLSGMLRKTIKELSPHYMAFAFHAKGPTCRQTKFKDYEIHKNPTRDELLSHLLNIFHVISAFNNVCEGYESDALSGLLRGNFPRRRLCKHRYTTNKDSE